MNARDDIPPSRSDLDNDGPIAAVFTDFGGRLLRATSPAAHLLGLSSAKIVGSRLIDFAAEGWQGPVENALLRMQSGSIDPFEVMLVGRSGRRSLIRMIPRRAQRLGGVAGNVLFWRRQAFSAEQPPTSSEAVARRFAYDLLRKHDDHRGRIAGELNHDVASLITVAKLTVESVAEQLQRGDLQEVSPLLSDTSGRLRESLVNVRRISTELLPSSLDDLGLVATIEWLCRQLTEIRPDMRVELQLEVDESSIGQAMKLDLYRIIEEALVNAGRHANASRARVKLVATQGQLQLTIEDDGHGFDVAPFKRGEADFRGLGLHSIGSRVDATHGSLHVESMPGTGTTIVATWPIDDASFRPR
jgi:two-component system NarL family sensor kinase